MADVTGIALYAALSEHIYRRNERDDHALKLGDIKDGLTPLTDLPLPGGLNLTQDTSGYIYSTGGGTSGFCAMVTLIGGKYVVTFRGTDSTVSAWESVYQNLLTRALQHPGRERTFTAWSNRYWPSAYLPISKDVSGTSLGGQAQRDPGLSSVRRRKKIWPQSTASRPSASLLSSGSLSRRSKI